MSPLTRREFLLAGAGLALAAACGNGDDADVEVTGDDQRGGGGILNLLVVSYVHVAGIDQRVTLAFLNEAGTAPVRPDGPVRVTIDGTEVPAELHAGGPELPPYLLLRHRFANPGYSEVRATYRGQTTKAAIPVVDPGAAKVPFPGTPMISVPTPTVADPRGVDPICTRQPACPLHDVSLDAALAEHRPLAVLFATPALCVSRFCGPVLDTLLAERDAFADRVRFVHVEIYTTLSRTAPLQDAVKAYKLNELETGAEPILFLAGPDGVVRERIDNAYDRREARTALDRLVSA